MTLSVFEIILGVENQVAEHERKSAVTQNILEFGVKPKKQSIDHFCLHSLFKLSLMNLPNMTLLAKVVW